MKKIPVPSLIFCRGETPARVGAAADGHAFILALQELFMGGVNSQKQFVGDQ
ncbi:MAG: hypothetical protein V3S22_05720 [Candidatus Neomarinimicrobiota bacterium]